MTDLAKMLNEAREKTAAESAAAEVRASLAKLDSEIVELVARRAGVEKRIANSEGLRGMLRRSGSDPHADKLELHRVDLAITEMKAQQSDGQARLRELTQDAHGAELARAALGAEMGKRTAALGPDHPGHDRLAEIAELREELLGNRRAANEVSSLAGELLLWVDSAEAAEDGSEVLHVELRSASHKWEQLGSFLPANALAKRSMLKDRLESFRAFDTQDLGKEVGAVLSLAADDHVVDGLVWLHHVRLALGNALEKGVASEKRCRQQLVAIDQERIEILGG